MLRRGENYPSSSLESSIEEQQNQQQVSFIKPLPGPHGALQTGSTGQLLTTDTDSSRIRIPVTDLEPPPIILDPPPPGRRSNVLTENECAEINAKNGARAKNDHIDRRGASTSGTGRPKEGQKHLVHFLRTPGPPPSRTTSARLPSRSELMSQVQRTTWARHTTK